MDRRPVAPLSPAAVSAVPFEPFAVFHLHKLAAGAVGLGVLSAGGCAAVNMAGDAAQEAWFQTKQTLRPDRNGYVDDAELVKEDWGDAAELGRRDQPRVADDPAWYRNIFMSEKARDIESNLGYD